MIFISLWIFCRIECSNVNNIYTIINFFFSIIFQSLIRMNFKYENLEFQWRYYLQASIVNLWFIGTYQFLNLFENETFVTIFFVSIKADCSEVTFTFDTCPLAKNFREQLKTREILFPNESTIVKNKNICNNIIPINCRGIRIKTCASFEKISVPKIVVE